VVAAAEGPRALADVAVVGGQRAGGALLAHLGWSGRGWVLSWLVGLAFG
jgi:hypothetical protein